MTPSILDSNEPEDFLKQLVGDDKKFKDAEALAKGKIESDSFIEQLKQENADLRLSNLQLREEDSKRAKLTDLISMLEAKDQQLASNNNPVNEVKEKPTFDPSQIESIVAKQIQNSEIARRQDTNARMVRDRLIEQFGDKYQDTVRKQIAELDITEDDFNEMARTKPKALFKTLGLDATPRETFQTPPRNSVQFRPTTQPKRTQSYYDEMKKANPKLYQDPKILIQMDKDSQELGEAFFDVA
jgi:hypothetical protein